ncbi:15464_t:CDS:1 [Dentiscutata heterogama]|uniref:15464_t:CDS:1 n=1 Tax=Dentiscutata heterogama TaxID=1316150 RepID=A0ACA9K6Y8_9GLOM|nr:15464_t:CDS:1 [Dentiscutata heterogama]
MDDVVEEKVEDWKKKYYERIKVPSVHHPEPSFPPKGTIDPVVWLNYRNGLNKYIEDLQLKPIFADLVYIKNLLAKYPYDDDKFIIKQYKASLGIITNSDESDKAKKTKTRRRYRNSFYAKNLLKVIRMLKEDGVREEFFRRAKFPITLLQDKDISPIIEEFIKS